jgi:predicted hotdog family 3-hydroxylacyl-ACP dehydratase
MNLAEIDIESYIPHRSPMRLVEKVVAVDDDEEGIETACTVRDTWPSANNGLSRTVLLVEVIAQSAGVLMGWRERNEGDGRGQGLLVGVRHASTLRPLVPLGTPMHCRVRLTHGVTHYAAFEGRVVDDHGVQWIEAELQAFRP